MRIAAIIGILILFISCNNQNKPPVETPEREAAAKEDPEHAGHGDEPSCGCEHGEAAPAAPKEHEHGESCDHGEPEGHEEPVAKEEHEHGESCDHGAPEGHDEHEGHDHGGHVHAELPREKLGAARCEHEMATAGCDECRYELGLVEVDEEIEAALVSEGEVKQDEAPERLLELRCEVGVNALASTDVVALRKGRVVDIRKGLGDTVQVGEVMGVLESDAFGEAARRHQEAHLARELAAAELKRMDTIQKNLEILVQRLREAGEKPLEPAVVAALPVGDRKADLLTAASDYWRALADWKVVEQRLADGQALLDHFENKKKVRLADLRVGEWKSRVLAARAQLSFARKAVKRTRPLVDKGVSRLRELEEHQRDLAAADAAYKGAMEVIRWEMQRERIGAEAEVRKTQAVLEARLEQVGLDLDVERLKVNRILEDATARMGVEHRTLAMFGYGPEEVDSVDLLAPERFGRMEIRSPVRGTVVGLFSSPGAVAVEGFRLFTITDPTRHWIWCDVHRGDLADLVKAGSRLPAEVSSAAWPGQSFLGQLDYLDWKADPHTRTVRARVVVEDKEHRLRPGLFVRAKVNLSGAGDGLWVPRSAVVSSADDVFVFVRWKERYWLKRSVIVEETVGDRSRIRGDVHPGDRVAISGAFFLKSDVMRESMGAGCAH
jgi:multidrug resistance efflux pump